MSKPLPRGVRLANPLNMEKGQPWQGLAPDQPDSRFCNFVEPAYGFRAAGKVFKTYKGRGVGSVRALITAWAPPKNNAGQVENDTEAYIRRVCKATGFGDQETLDILAHDVAKPIMKAMSVVEQGGWFFTDAQLDKGLAMAGIRPPEKPLQASRTVKGSQVAAAGTAGAAVLQPEVLGAIKGVVEPIRETVPQVNELLGFLAPFSPYLKFGLIALAIAGIAWMVWARIDDRRRGLR